MLTLNKTDKPIAIIISGKEKGTIVYYSDKVVENRSLLKKKIDTELITQTGTFFPIPKVGAVGERDLIHILGKSGAGKSTWMSEYVKLYHKMLPKNEIILYSNKPKDESFDKLNYVDREEIDDSLIDDPVKLSDISNSLVIMDDVDSFSDRDIENAIIKIQNDIYMLGRDPYKISMLHSKHLGLDNSKSKVAYSEMKGFVFFPKATNPHHVRTILQKYCNMNKDQINKIYNLESRWVYVNVECPSYMISEKKIYIL